MWDEKCGLSAKCRGLRGPISSKIEVACTNFKIFMPKQANSGVTGPVCHYRAVVNVPGTTHLDCQATSRARSSA